MTKTNDFIWKGIQTICWFIFAGLCVQTGALLFNFVYSLFNPIATYNLHLGLNLSSVYQRSKSVYISLFSLAIIISTIKAVVFYFVLQLFKKLKFVQPFTETVAKYISTISYYAFSVGVISYIAHHFVKNLLHKNYNVHVVERYWNDNEAYLMLSAILFVIALIFQKGIELQTENDLTV